MTEKRRPWGKWYWGDWRGDMRLHRCSYGARGLWADMLSIMGEEADHFGFLMVDGKVFDAVDLAEEFGGKRREIEGYLIELREKKVFSTTGDLDIPDELLALVPDGLKSGIIFSRRMVRDQHRDLTRHQNGKLGGNPKLVGEVNQQVGSQMPEARDKRPEKKKEDAAPLGAGATAPVGLLVPSQDDRTWVFNEGLAWLAQTAKRPDRPLRSLFGKQLQALANDASQLRLAIEEGMRQPTLADPIAWLNGAVKARAAHRAAPAAQATAGGRVPQVSLSEALDAAQEQMARHFAKTGKWPAMEGPAPGQPGCRLAPEVLAKYGLPPTPKLAVVR